MSHILRVHVRNFPPETQWEVEGLVQKYAFFIPNWLHEFYLYNRPETDSQARATIWCDPEYNQAGIQLHGPFWEQNEFEREQALVHELAHIFTWDLKRFASKLVETCISDENAKTLLMEQHRQVSESMVHNLAWAVTIREGKGKIPPLEVLRWNQKPEASPQYDSQIKQPFSPGVRANQEGITDAHRSEKSPG